eukprot:m.79095 g.79095  ORF g.79095 m.79095 type:complete len:422 (+) comp25178_c0_seq1:266-1531(+)
MDALLAAVDDDDGGDFEDENDSSDEVEAEQDEQIEALGEVDDNALTCKIFEFFPQDEKMCYRINGTTTLSEFQKQQFSTLRRYEDFLWLHDRLLESKTLAGVVIPSLPKKVTWVSPEPTRVSQKVDYSEVEDAKLLDEFQKRAHQLNRFLKFVCRHKLLREDLHVIVFLEYAEDLKPNNKKSWFGGNIWYWDWIDSNRDDNCRQEREWIVQYRKKLEETIPLAQEKAMAFRNLSDAEVEVMHATRMWDEDPDTTESRIFRYFSNALIRSQINHHLQAQVGDSITDLLNDVDGSTTATISMLDRSAGVQAMEKESEVVLNRALRSAGPVEQRSQSTTNKLQKLQAEHADVVLAAEFTEKTFANELIMAKKRRISDFKDLFVTLAQHEMHQAKARVESWEEFLAEIKRVEIAPPRLYEETEEE